MSANFLSSLNRSTSTCDTDKTKSSFPWGNFDHFQLPLPPIQCWKEWGNRSIEWMFDETHNRFFFNFRHRPKLPTLENSPILSSTLNGGKGLKRWLSLRENWWIRHNLLNIDEIRMRAKDFAPPLVDHKVGDERAKRHRPPTDSLVQD